jgi:hypothetical protein
MPRVVKESELDRGRKAARRSRAKAVDMSARIPDELRWTMDPFASVPNEARTYGEGVNAELDRAKAVQKKIYEDQTDTTTEESETENA